MIRTKKCNKCGKTKSIDEFNKDKNKKDGRGSHCKRCNKKYRKEYREENREKLNKKSRKYSQEHKDKIRKQQGHISMHENKLCSSYLGVFIAERLCKHLFKNVEVMPYGFPGYDIVCNRGKKIDVKSSTTHSRHSKYPFWTFHIDYNKIADFFILVAFDDKEDLNPLHMWMIPGKEINHRSGKSISLSTIHKWSRWERSIEEVQMCCAELNK